MEKLKILVTWMKARLGERSTWAFWFGSAGLAFMFSFPSNVFVSLAVFAAGFVPDTFVLGKKDDL